MPEYDAETRGKDSRILEYGKRTESNEDQEKLTGKKRRRKEKKKNKQLEKLLSAYTDRALKCDETLLAIIGILDALKLESNVASWIRAGGLWAGYSTAEPLSDASSDMEMGSDAEHRTKTRRRDGDADVSWSKKDLEQRWYANPDVLDHWAARGRSALDTLQIPISSGLVE